MIYQIRDGFDKMDFERVTSMLATSFWTPEIGVAEVIKGAQNSAMVVGAFTEETSQIGYARAISDKTRFAYILDVIVDEPFRRQGVGQAMLRHILESPDLQDVYQWMLITKDAHGVYRKLGFKPIRRPDDWMEFRTPRPR